MIIDKQLCNRILESLGDDFPSHMSSASWTKATSGETEIKKVAAQFKYLDEKGLINTIISEESDASGNLEFYVELGGTRITAYGIDFIDEGGFE